MPNRRVIGSHTRAAGCVRSVLIGFSALSLITCGPGSSDPNKEGRQPERLGFWITPVPYPQAIPGVGTLVWGWGDTLGLTLTDYDSVRVNAPRRFLPEWRIQDVTPYEGGAWLLAAAREGGSNTLFRTTTLPPKVVPVAAVPAGFRASRLFAPQDGRHVWLVGDTLQGLGESQKLVAYPGLYVAAHEVSGPFFTDRRPSFITPIPNTDQAWLVSYPLGVTAPNPLTTPMMLAIVAADGRIIKEISSVFPNVQILQVFISKGGGVAWLLAADGRVYIADSTGRALNGGAPLALRVPIGRIYLTSDGLTGWLLPARGLESPERRRPPGIYVHRLNDNRTPDGVPILGAMTVSEFTLSAEGNTAWVLDDSTRELWHVDLTSSGAKKQLLLSGYWSAEVIPLRGEADRAWLIVRGTNGEGLILHDQRSGFINQRRVLTEFLRRPKQYFPVDGGESLLITDWASLFDTVSYVARPATTLGEVKLSFGDALLRSTGHYSHLSIDPTRQGREVSVSLPINTPAGSTVSVFLTEAGQRVAAATRVLDGQQGRFGMTLTFAEGALTYGRPYDVEMVYNDDLGSHVAIQWDSVRFNAPLLERPRVRSLLVYLVFAVVIILLQLFRSTSPIAAKWLPAVLLASGSGLSGLTGLVDTLNLDGQFLALLVGASLLLLLPLGFVSPALLRSFARTAPLHWIAPFVLLLPKARGRVYMPYITELNARLQKKKEGANHEEYVAIPVETLEANDGAGLDSCSYESAAAAIFATVSATQIDDRSTVVIEAPGGSGKSALLREILRLALEEFGQNDRAPLPVLCDSVSPDAKSIEDLVAAGLGRHLISRETLSAELTAGLYLLVIDGVTESAIPPAWIEAYLRSEAGTRSRLLVTKRPDVIHSATLRASNRCIVVAPLKLTEDTYERFESAYVAADSKRLQKPCKRLSPELKSICRGPDATYLPILVRFCLLAGDEGVTGVAEVYEATFYNLLGGERNPTRLKQAGDLCVATYWADPQRRIALSRIGDKHSQIVELLIAANILVPVAETRNRITNLPTEASFFHDSMQSYLTAFGLFQLPDAWDCLARAAGDPGFEESVIDLGLGTGSELFQMCVAIYRPQTKVCEQLRRELLEWADAYDDVLTKAAVKSVLPPALSPDIVARFRPEDGPGKLVVAAVAACAERPLDVQLRLLTYLYMGLAPLVWKLHAQRHLSAAA